LAVTQEIFRGCENFRVKLRPMKKTIVTGGAWFIGSHLAGELAGRGYQTIILDDLSTGKVV